MCVVLLRSSHLEPWQLVLLAQLVPQELLIETGSQ
jgi:hypothetical protein